MGEVKKQSRLIHLYTGDGKGKTTAAVGLAVRARGAGWKVLFCQFYKPDGSSELDQLQKLGITIKRFMWRGSFFKKYTEDELKAQAAELEDFLTEIEEEWNHYDLVVLDEVVYAITDKIISEEYFLSFLKKKPASIELVMTGRNYPASIRAIADYVMDLKLEKHPFTQGIPARKGVEY